ncbi:MAG TPA: hypothetical protein VGM98_17410, partial [Schlesneria sp.]
QQTETTQQPLKESTASPRLTATRCQARNRNGSRCRLRAQHPGSPLCRRHAARAGTFADTLDDSLDVSVEVFASQEGSYDTTETINAILSNVVELLARGRISTRRASVVTYALSLMLRSVTVADRQALMRLPLDYAPRPLREPLDSPPTTPAEAVAAHKHLRT